MIVLLRKFKKGQFRAIYHCKRILHIPAIHAIVDTMYLKVYSSAISDDFKIESRLNKIYNRYENPGVYKVVWFFYMTEYYFWKNNKDKFCYYSQKVKQFIEELPIEASKGRNGLIETTVKKMDCYDTLLCDISLENIEKAVLEYNMYIESKLGEKYHGCTVGIFKAILAYKQGQLDKAYDILSRVNNNPELKNNINMLKRVDQLMNELKQQGDWKKEVL